MPELLIASHNRGKLRELREIVGDLPITLLDLTDLGISAEIAETGDTFEENAAIKAAGFARLAGIPTLADDSGLAIDFLNGRPGVHSARYAGSGASDQDRVEKVLAEMANAPSRSARFVCVTALADGDGRIVASVKGTCEGTIVKAPRGSSGFGYDPIFLPDGFSETFAELAPESKNRISHRAKSLSKMLPFLQGFFDVLT